MASYYIDYENVHNEGLKGVHKLEKGDKLYLFYSSKADTLKIDMVRQLMECTAEIRFDKIVNGVENALDFQLITALMCNYYEDENYYIISRDKGYDAAIEMAGKQKRENIYRCRDIDGAIKHQVGLGIDESGQEIIVDLEFNQALPESEAEAEDVIQAEEAGMLENTDEAELPENAAEAVSASEDAEPVGKGKAVRAGKAKASRAGADAAPAAPQDDTETPDGEDDPASALALPEQSEEEQEAGAAEQSEAEVAEEERRRRAYQSICTKILNHIKLTHKIPLTYKQAGVIYEALSESDSKMQFYHKLIQFLGRKKGGELYQKVKITYKSIAGIYKASSLSPEGDSDSAGDAAESRDDIDDAKAAFEHAEQSQGNPGEAILRLVELTKNI